jgi:hypothetical protein
MTIRADEYEIFSGFLEYFFNEVLSGPLLERLLVEEAHPGQVLARMEGRLSKSQLRRGLELAINDCAEMSANFSAEQVKDMDTALAAKGLPTLSSMRARFWKRVQTPIKRGRIRGEVEYYAVRSAAEIADESIAKQLWALITEFESRSAANRRS